MDDGRQLRIIVERSIANSRVLRDAAVEARERARLMIEISRGRRSGLDPDRPTAFRVDVDRTSPPGTTLRVHGDLDLATGPRLTEVLLAELSGEQAAPLRIDLAAVTFVGVGSLRELLGAVHRAQRGGVDVAVVNESPAVLGLLGLAGRVRR